MVSIFNYSFNEAVEALNNGNITYKSLTDYDNLIGLAIEKGIISANEEQTLHAWRQNPSQWGLR